MPSSRTEELLGELRALYDDGLEAVLGEDFERVAAVLDRADALIEDLPAPESDAEHLARDEARAAWSRLQGALAGAREETRRELAQARQGRRVARAYGSGRREAGRRHRSEL